MSATLLIDDDVAALLRATAGKAGQAESEFASRILRQALSGPVSEAPVRPFSVRPHDGVFRPGVDLRKLNQLVGAERIKS